MRAIVGFIFHDLAFSAFAAVLALAVILAMTLDSGPATIHFSGFPAPVHGG